MLSRGLVYHLRGHAERDFYQRESVDSRELIEQPARQWIPSGSLERTGDEINDARTAVVVDQNIVRTSKVTMGNTTLVQARDQRVELIDECRPVNLRCLKPPIRSRRQVLHEQRSTADSVHELRYAANTASPRQRPGLSGAEERTEYQSEPAVTTRVILQDSLLRPAGKHHHIRSRPTSFPQRFNKRPIVGQETSRNPTITRHERSPISSTL